MQDQDFTSIVFGADALGYSYAREMYRVYGKKSIINASLVQKYTEKSKFTDYHVFENADREDVMLEWLKKNAGSFQSKPLVFGGAGDWRARTLSEHKKELTDLGYVIPYIDFALLDKVTQKDIFYAMCDRLGVPYPKTKVLPFGDYDASVLAGTDMETVTKEDLKDLEYPLIAKPSNSAGWHNAEIRDRHKVYKIDSAEQMEQVYEDVAASNYSYALLLQEVLSTRDESLHSLTTFSDAEGNLVVAVSGDVLIQDRTPAGIGNPLCILGDQRRRDLLEAAAKLIKDMKYEGYANFDVMDGEDGKPRFLEVNTRAGRNTYYVSLAGCPFVKPIVEYYVYGKDLREALTKEEQEADKPFLFSMVPRSVIAKETHGDKKQRALKMFDSGNWGSPLLCKEDSVGQRFWAKVNFEHMKSKF